MSLKVRRFDLYIGHFHEHTIPKAHTEEENV